VTKYFSPTQVNGYDIFYFFWQIVNGYDLDNSYLEIRGKPIFVFTQNSSSSLKGKGKEKWKIRWYQPTNQILRDYYYYY